MKKILLTIFLYCSFLSATDYANDISDFYVQGNELNDSLQAINLYTCFIGAGISRAGLLNEKAYRVLTSEDLCINRYSPILSQQKSEGYVAKSASTEQEDTDISFKDISFNEAIFQVTRESNSSPVKAKVWSSPYPGSTNPAKLPQKIFYDFSFSQFACNEYFVAKNIPCSKYGKLTLEYAYQPLSTWNNLTTWSEDLGIDIGTTAGMGKIIVNDNTIDYLAHAGQATYNVKLTNNGDVSTGVFEKFRSAQVGWPWAIGYRFYMNTAEDKRFFCQKYDYARMLAYVIPWDPGTENHGSSWHAFKDTTKKAGPKRLADASEIGGSSDFTAFVKTGYIDQGYAINEACFTLDKTQVRTVVDHYRLYDSSGAKFDLTQKAFSISAKATGTNDFPGNNMYAWANEWGVWLDHKYNSYVDENTVWKNNNPNATAAEKAKSYTLQSNHIVATEISIRYLALDELHGHTVQMYARDESWNSEYKALGFCGSDGLTNGGQACTFYNNYVGYYDKNLNGEDADSGTKGGFVFVKYYNCDPDGCTSGDLTGANIIKFENTQWLSNMRKTFGSVSYVRDMHLIDRSAKTYFRISKANFENQTLSDSTNGLKYLTYKNVALSDMPTTLQCIIRCIDPAALNASYQGLFTAGAAIAANPSTQNWQFTNISGGVARALGSSPYHDVGAYIKSSETTGGTLTIDPDRNPGTQNYTRSNAVGTGWDGVTEDDKKTYTVSNNQIFYDGVPLTFDATNKATLANIKDVPGYLSGAKVSTGYVNFKPNVSWGVESYLIEQSELDKAECDKQYNDFGTDNNEYKYRPGWDAAKSALKRYCVGKFYQGKVNKYYRIIFRSAPTYNLMEGNAVVTFDKPRSLKLVIPANQNYETELHGQTFYLTFQGDGTPIWGIPKERYDTETGNIIEDSVAWSNSHKIVDKFVIADGQEVTDVENGKTYKIRALRGNKYLKPLPISSALNLIGGGASSIPYDMEAQIASTDILRDISNNGSATDYIGAEPTDLLNNGVPCVVDGFRNTRDTAGCPFK